jgi:hypothetical protein
LVELAAYRGIVNVAVSRHRSDGRKDGEQVFHDGFWSLTPDFVGERHAWSSVTQCCTTMERNLYEYIHLEVEDDPSRRSIHRYSFTAANRAVNITHIQSPGRFTKQPTQAAIDFILMKK